MREKVWLYPGKTILTAGKNCYIQEKNDCFQDVDVEMIFFRNSASLYSHRCHRITHSRDV